MGKYALEVENVSKSFRLPTEQASGIKQAFVNWTRGIKGYKEQKVLEDISFKVEKGDFFGIVGRNGSGKSTLLKIISQIYEPEKGEVKVNGTLVPFIELGVGFNPELTGRENVYLNGALLGFSHEEISELYSDIVEFAELEEFMDQKLKNYSSGMQVRLAFSIAIKADADVLVLDEVLAVGDEAFQRKCFNYFAHLKKAKKTVILVTHSMGHVLQFCNKAAIIDENHKIELGTPGEIAQTYRRLNSENKEGSNSDSSKFTGSRIDDINISIDHINTGDSLKFNTSIKSKIDIRDAVFTFVITKNTGEPIYRWVSDERFESVVNIQKNKTLNIDIELQNIFPDGVFGVQVGIKKRDRTEEYIVIDDCINFEIINVRSPYPNDIHWKPNETMKISE